MSVANEKVAELASSSEQIEQCVSRSSHKEQLDSMRTSSPELLSEFLRIFIDVLGILPEYSSKEQLRYLEMI
jgi:hypothetical protein